MINDLKDDLGIKEFNRMSCDTHVKRDSSEIGLSIPETFNDNYFLFKKSLKQPLWCKSLKSHSTTGSFKKGSNNKQTVLEDKMKTDLQKIKEENAKRIKFDGNSLRVLGAKISLHAELMENDRWAFKDLKEFEELNHAVKVVADQLIKDVSSWVNSDLSLEDK